MRSRILGAVVLVAILAGAWAWFSSDPAKPAAKASTGPRLHAPHPCTDLHGSVERGYTCWTLTVPLDHSGGVPGTLDLQVGTADGPPRPKGTLLFLTGGPGQGGTDAMHRLADLRLPAVARDYRFVMIDQRGTGAKGAIDCPKLQSQVGSSDIAVPSADAVDECATLLGRTARFYSTDQTVADLETLRQALGVPTMAVDGVSYGTWTAERYTIAHPDRVAKLVLDSVVPHHATTADSLYLVGLRAQAEVFRTACQAPPACDFDPADDLAWVVRHRSTAEGVRLFDTIVSYEFRDSSYRDAGAGDLLDSLHAARTGDPSRLAAIEKAMDPADGTTPATFSAGLHAATLCSDMRFPWGDATAPVARRSAQVEGAGDGLSDSDTWPYTPQVAIAQGFLRTCERWPVEQPDSNPAGRLPDVPTLLLNGDHDLSTPLEWAREEAALSPHGRLVVVPGASHSVQGRESGQVGRSAVTAFLDT